MKHWRECVAISAVGMTLAACADGSGDGAGSGLTISSVNPNHGAQGIEVVVSGAEFTQGMDVCFGAGNCVTAQVVDSGSAKVNVPSGEGIVDVIVKNALEQDVLRNGFEYEKRGCDYTGAKCSADGIYRLTCEGGIERQEKCEEGCDGTTRACRVKQGDPCDYTGAKCSADGTQSLTCEHGVERQVSCFGKGCDTATGTCKSEPAVSEPKISGMSPSSGKAGAVLTIHGDHLEQVESVCFGETCVQPQKKTASEVSVEIPAGTGIVDVAIVVGEKKIVTGSFTYLLANKDWCRLTWCEVDGVGSTDCRLSMQEGDKVRIYAQVYRDGVTGTSGSHEGIFGQAGYISQDGAVLSDMDAYKWVNGVRNEAFMGEASANNDEFMSEGIGLEKGGYRVAYRFGDGHDWLYCDVDGSENGFDVNKAGSFTVVAKEEQKPKEVEWCRIMNGTTSITTKSNEATDGIYAQAYVSDCTHYQNHCENLKAQAGYGLEALADVSAFTWQDAQINAAYDGSGGENHDEFMATLKESAPGSYHIVYRMSMDGGTTWKYCDTADSTSFNLANAMKWTVEKAGVDPEPEKKEVAWCRTVTNPVTSQVGDLAGEIRGEAYVAGCTGGEKGCTELKGRLVYGKSGKALSEHVESKFSGRSGNNDMYVASLGAQTEAGEYRYAYQFSLDGENWVSCSADTAGGILDEGGLGDEKNLGKLTVKEKSDKKSIGWCGITTAQHLDMKTGDEKPVVNAEVWVDGCTGASRCEDVVAWIGVGGADDGIDQYVFKQAAYSKGSNNNDVYSAVADIDMGAEGTHRVLYAFSVGEKGDRMYCTTNAGGNTLVGAEVDLKDAVEVLVKEASPRKIEWCRLVSSGDVTEVKGQESMPVHGQALVTDCTGDAGPCEGLTGYIGYGEGDDASKYRYVEAEYYKQVGHNDEYWGRFVPEKEGNYKLIYAFSLDGGKTKTYCSTADGKAFDISDAAKLGVNVASQKPLHYGTDYTCGMEGNPVEISGKAGMDIELEGRIWVNGCAGDAACSNVRTGWVYIIDAAQAESNPLETSLSKWQKVRANYSGKSGNNDVYVAKVRLSEGKYAFAYGFSVQYSSTYLATNAYCYAGWDHEKKPYGTITVTK